MERGMWELTAQTRQTIVVRSPTALLSTANGLLLSQQYPGHSATNDPRTLGSLAIVSRGHGLEWPGTCRLMPHTSDGRANLR